MAQALFIEGSGDCCFFFSGIAVLFIVPVCE